MQPSNLFHVYCPGCGYMTDANTRFCIKCGTSVIGAPQASSPTLLPPTSKPSPQLSPLSAFSLDGGRYVDIKPLSDRGGMGLIFHAHDIRGGYRECIIKQLRPDPDLDQALFEREAALLATLHHDHIPACWDHFTENGAHYLVSEFIQGVALQDLIEQYGPASEHEVIRWGLISAMP